MKIHSFTVQPNLPDNIKFLEELASDMWFTWNWPAILLFVQIDPKLWTASRRNPKWMLGSVPQKRLEELSRDTAFVEQVNKVKEAYYNYKNNSHTWYKEHKKELTGQLDMYNYKLAEIAHELDKVDINGLTPIDALNALVKIKEKLK